MRSLAIPALTLAGLLAAAPSVVGSEDPAPASATSCRADAIPAHRVIETRTVKEPAVRTQRRVPRYRTVRVPVYEERKVPIYETVERPVHETFEVPVFRTERVPVWGEKQVPVFREVRTPVTFDVWNPITCCHETIELWDRCEEVQTGTRLVKAIVGHEERQVPCGTRLERVQIGTRKEQIVTGHRYERFKTGDVEKQRLVGYGNEWVVVTPATERTVTRQVPVPCEAVTVIPDGTRLATPLPNTSRILTETEFAEALAAARASASRE